MSAYSDEVDDYDHDYDDNDDGYDAVLGSLGEVINYGYAPPASSASPASSYNTVSDDERAYGSVQQPTKEFSIWDSVAKPGKKARTPTHSTTRRTSTKKKPHTSHSVASSNRSNSEFISPVIEPPIIKDMQAIHQPEPAQGIDSQSLLLLGVAALGAVLWMRGK